MTPAAFGTGGLPEGAARLLIDELGDSWRQFERMPDHGDVLILRGLARFERRKAGRFGVRRWFGRRTAAGDKAAALIAEALAHGHD